MDQKIRQDVARRKLDMAMLKNAKKKPTIDQVIHVQQRLNKDEKLLARFKNYNNFIDRQSRQRPTFSTMEQFRQVARPYFPKAFLDSLYRADTLGLASIQIDKILAFQEVPF